jgi:DNA-binding GntR family transcriptional regulator
MTALDLTTASALPRVAFAAHETGGDRLSDRASDQLRSMIITLQLEPGAILDEGVYSTRLGIGRTPLREAVQRLADEGLAVILPRRAVAVSQITVTDLQQIYEARLAFEAASARLASVRATAADLARISQHIDCLPRPDAADQDADPTNVVACDFNFHHSIAGSANNRYLHDSIRKLLGPAMRMTFLAHRHGQPVRETFDEHSAILEALRRRDPDAAEHATRCHILAAKERILNRL